MSGPKELIEQLRARQLNHAKVGAFDVDGLLRGKYISLDKLSSALDGGFGFCDVIFGWDIVDALYDKSSVSGWHRGFPDVQAVLDPHTLREMPWELGVAFMLADLRDDDGGPHPACPRSLLKTIRDRARAQGYEPLFSCEYEFFLFKESPDTLQEKDFRGITPLSPGMFGYSVVRSGQRGELMKDILEGMAAFDVELEGLHTETGPGVYEAAIAYDEVLRAADKAALFKTAMKQIAHKHGLSVTFMAKWNQQLPGASGHLHQSLQRKGKNVFYSDGGISDTMRYYVGGLCELMGELTAMASPTVNSYKRYVPGVWAPLTVGWGVDNRTVAARLIGLDSKKACRVEFRQTAADLNPYIAMAANLGAGLWGIENAVEPPPQTEGDATKQGPPLPGTLKEATALLDKSERARAIFGDAFVSHYVHTRDWEVREFERAVTDWELRRYFETV